MNLPATALLVLLPLAASAALAGEDVYRSTMPNGEVRYGESPAPGAKSVRKIPAPPTSTGTIIVTPEDKTRASTSPPQTAGGVSVIPQKERQPAPPATTGGGASYGEGPGPLPKPAY